MCVLLGKHSGHINIIIIFSFLLTLDPLFRYLFSFLASLVDLDVVTDVHINYLLVGHTGNEVDQLFRNAVIEKKIDLAFFYIFLNSSLAIISNTIKSLLQFAIVHLKGMKRLKYACIVLFAHICIIFTILSTIFYALYYIHYIICIVLYALYSMHCILFIVFNVLYSIHCFLCNVFYAISDCKQLVLGFLAPLLVAQWLECWYASQVA